jgi:hypothetical protein
MSYLVFVFLFYCLSLSFQLQCEPSSHPHLANFSQISIGLTSDGFCVGEGVTESCCSGNWETLVDSTWNSWFGQLEHKFSTITGTLSQAHQYIRGLNCASSEHISNKTLSLYKETLNSIEDLQIDWKRILFNITNMECRLKLVQAAHCPACNNIVNIRPCRSLCTNILRGCLWQLESIQAPWKHAINSVRTAVRLLDSPQTEAECRVKELEWFTTTLNSWREPLHWLDSTCEILPDNTNECYNGKTKGLYKKAVSSWSNQKSNPEFMIWSQSQNDVLSPNVITVKERLTNISKTLEEFWPRLADASRGAEDGMSSDEAEGSASGSYPTEMETDDEDLLNEDGSGDLGLGDSDDDSDGLGSGNGDDVDELPSWKNEIPATTTTTTAKPPTRDSSAAPQLPSCHLLVVFAAVRIDDGLSVEQIDGVFVAERGRAGRPAPGRIRQMNGSSCVVD